MKDKFTIDFDYLTNQLSTERIYKLADVQDRIEKVAYDIVRFRDNKDTDQLWKIEDRADGPVIIALYNDDGSLLSESAESQEWDAIPDKTAMNIFYKGESIVALSETELGISKSEFPLVRKWLPKKLAASIQMQRNLFGLMPAASKKLVIKRFPELEKIAQMNSELTALRKPSNPSNILERFLFAQQIKRLVLPTSQDVEKLVKLLHNENVQDASSELIEAANIVKDLYKTPQDIQEFIYSLYRNPEDVEAVKKQDLLVEQQDTTSKLSQLKIPSPPFTTLQQFLFAQQVKQLFFTTSEAVQELVRILKDNVDLTYAPISNDMKQVIQVIRLVYADPDMLKNFIYMLYRSPSDLEDIKRQQRLADVL